MTENLKRIFNFAVNDLNRNKGISVAAIFVLIITIMLVTGLVFFQGVANYVTAEIKNKIDITAYFKDGVEEEKVLSVRDEIIKLSPNIKNVEYVSKDQALEIFNEKHKDNPVLSQALQEVGDNPFLPSLNITTDRDPVQYASIASILQNSDFGEIIESVDFSQKKDTIDKVYSIVSNINIFGILLSIVLVIIAVSVVFSTIKLTIDNAKDEISTMQVVGASDKFIKGPFVIQGMLYGLVAFLVCFLLSALFSYFLSFKTQSMLPGFNIFGYFLTNWWIFVLIQLGFGVIVGGFSALIVVKRYLEK